MIHKCPICGERLQATITTYTKHVVLDDEGSVDDEGQDAGLGADLDVYCGNDHQLDEMLAVATGGKNHPSGCSCGSPECPEWVDSQELHIVFE